MFDKELRTLRTKPGPSPLPYWQLAALGSAIVASIGGLLWRLFAGPSDTSSPDRLAATTAASVADAARQQVLDAADDNAGSAGPAVEEAAAAAIIEAASAGADLVAAAYGAIDGAIHASRDGHDSEVVDAAVAGVREAAGRVGPAAHERVDWLIRERFQR